MKYFNENFAFKGLYVVVVQERVRNDVFGYRRYKALAKHIKHFLKKR